MKLLYAILLLSVLSATPALAKTISLPQLEEQGQKIQTWRADFEQITTVAALGEDVQKTGTISVSKPKKFNIRYESAPAKTYLYNGKKLWIHQIQSESVLQYDKPGALISSEALSFLGGLENLSTLFAEAPDEEVPEFEFKNKKLATVTLKPLSDNTSLAYLVLGLDANLDTREAFVWTPGGNRTHYIFSNVQKNTPLEDNLFSWTDRPGVKVIKQ